MCIQTQILYLFLYLAGKFCIYMNRIAIYLFSFVTSKQIKLESPGWSGFVANAKSFTSWPTGTFFLNKRYFIVHLEVVHVWTGVFFFSQLARKLILNGRLSLCIWRSRSFLNILLQDSMNYLEKKWIELTLIPRHGKRVGAVTPIVQCHGLILQQQQS